MDDQPDVTQESLEAFTETLIADPHFSKLVMAVETDYIRDFLTSNPTDRETREASYWALRGLTKLVGKISALSNSRAYTAKNEELKAQNYGVV